MILRNVNHFQHYHNNVKIIKLFFLLYLRLLILLSVFKNVLNQDNFLMIYSTNKFKFYEIK